MRNLIIAILYTSVVVGVLALVNYFLDWDADNFTVMLIGSLLYTNYESEKRKC